MNLSDIQKTLQNLPIPAIKYFDSVGSTNDIAMQWVFEGGEDYSLVVADSQTSGKGRLGRQWVTNPGVALAFSLILHPNSDELKKITLFSGLGAISVNKALLSLCNLHSEIKWPNDVLIERKKVAGVLVETSWMKEHLDGVVIGIGINVKPAALPTLDKTRFPSTCIEENLGERVDRLILLKRVLECIIQWRKFIGTEQFFEAWESKLAYRNELVSIIQPNQPVLTGTLIGINQYGNLILKSQMGDELIITVGDLHLRPYNL